MSVLSKLAPWVRLPPPTGTVSITWEMYKVLQYARYNWHETVSRYEELFGTEALVNAESCELVRISTFDQEPDYTQEVYLADWGYYVVDQLKGWARDVELVQEWRKKWVSGSNRL